MRKFKHSGRSYYWLNGREDTKKDIENTLKLKAFYNHCCRSRHYFFSIKKCVEDSCDICKPLRMVKEDFSSIKHGAEDHYLPFQEAKIHLKRTDPLYHSQSKGESLFPSHLVYSMSETLRSCFNVRNVTCRGFCTPRESYH